MHVVEGSNGNNWDFGVVAFVWQGTWGQNYHIYTYGTDNNHRSYAIYAV
jgi:hypothetical protein